MSASEACDEVSVRTAALLEEVEVLATEQIVEMHADEACSLG